MTPIPPRASAHPVKVRRRYPYVFATEEAAEEEAIWEPRGGNEVQRPGAPLWQYESSQFEAESSLSALSLVVSELPTQPKQMPPAVSIEEIDTVPAVARNVVPIKESDTCAPVEESPLRAALAEIDTQPPAVVEAAPAAEADARLPVPVESGELETSSWTAGGALRSAHARRLIEPQAARRPFTNPLDRLRWWLLLPGRIEFLLWIAGTVLLVSVTCALILLSALSFGWPGAGQSTNTSARNSIAAQTPAGLVSPSGMRLVCLDSGPLRAGQQVRLRGSGFSPASPVLFSYDNRESFLDQHAQPVAVLADSRGTFTVTLTLESSWRPGRHTIVAKDVKTNHVAVLPFELVTATSRATATPHSSSVPGSAPYLPGANSPVATQPAASSPQPRPSASPTRPSATSTASPGATATATRSSTSSSGSPVPVRTVTATSNGLGDSLLDSLSQPSGAPGSWSLVLLPTYALAMALLGVAGMVRRRQRRI